VIPIHRTRWRGTYVLAFGSVRPNPHAADKRQDPGSARAPIADGDQWNVG
jgi:hypothetical protein